MRIRNILSLCSCILRHPSLLTFIISVFIQKVWNYLFIILFGNKIFLVKSLCASFSLFCISDNMLWKIWVYRTAKKPLPNSKLFCEDCYTFILSPAVYSIPSYQNWPKIQETQHMLLRDGFHRESWWAQALKSELLRLLSKIVSPFLKLIEREWRS